MTRTLLALVLLAASVMAVQAASIGGKLRLRSGETSKPVAGVTLTARSESSGQSAQAVSGEDGSFDIPVPAAGRYQVTLDSKTLPRGVDLPAGRSTTLTVDVGEGQRKLVIFPLAQAGAGEQQTGPSAWVRFLQLIVDGTVSGLVIAMAAVGLSLIYGISRIINFAHGEFMTLGAILAYALSSMEGGPQLPLVLAAAVSLIVVGALGGAFGIGLVRPLETRAKDHFAILVFTIGLSFAMRFVLLAVFGPNSYPFREYALQEPIRFWGLILVPRDLTVAIISVLILVALGVFLLFTRTGRAMRAVAANPSLAEATGIDVNRIKRSVWILGAGLAAAGGVLMAVSQQVRWDMGYQMLMFVFAAVILGGIGTAFGTIAGGVVLGICMELSTLVFPVEIKTALAMLAMSAALLVRPQGLFNRAQRVG
ncbi:MAG: branched-chain amino acid ABC transporter permease [Rhizobiaceae bacterium]|jgi:branched-chain amino acid transport system permease protein